MVSPPAIPEASSQAAALSSAALTDSYGRIIRDLRVSITDRCNFRCVYCRTGNNGPQYAELSLDEYLRIIRVFVSLGIEKVRLTGGEPLMRRDITELISEIARLRTPAGQKLDIAATTNGYLLEGKAEELKAAGLSRITVSMDAVDAPTFERITRIPGSFNHVVRGLHAAERAGLAPVKVNCVVMRGFNDDQIPLFAKFAREEGVIVRFIEFMPLEEGRTWTRKTVVSLPEVVAKLETVRPVVRLKPNTPSETAVRYTFDDGIGEVGIIAPVSQPFCGQCSRVRLTSDGKIRTCLFSIFDHDLYGEMKRGATDEELADYITRVVYHKEARHHIGEPGFQKPSRSMVHLGG